MIISVYKVSPYHKQFPKDNVFLINRYAQQKHSYTEDGTTVDGYFKFSASKNEKKKSSIYSPR